MNQNRFLYSLLVFIITFITVLAIFTFKESYIVPTNQPVTEENTKVQKPEGTGYIFDYDNQLNIPIDDNGQ